MSTRNLDALFAPKAIALVGASNKPASVGATLARNLFRGGFAGPVMTVNPHERAIQATLSYRSVAELPLAPDLAVLSTPPAEVPRLITQLGERGCRAAVVVSAGFGEGGRVEGQALRLQMLDAARPFLMRIVGPNCLGFISPGHGINASFAHCLPGAGDIALVTQSGAIAGAILDWAASRAVGLSHVVSLGDMSDVDFGDLLDYLALDAATRAIILYVESITSARKFMTAARIAARLKPVIVLKAGRSAAGARAALSHTGALAGADAVYDAAFRRAGLLRVQTLRELFEAVATLSAGIRVAGDRLAIVTNGGGAGVLAADALEAAGGQLATLSPATMSRLDARLPTGWSHGNPVDLVGDADAARYTGALLAVSDDAGVDAVLAINCPVAVADSLQAADAVARTVGDYPRVPVFTCWLGTDAALPSRRLFESRRIPSHETPEEAIAAFMHLVLRRRNQQMLMQTPVAADPGPVDRAAAAAVLRRVLAEGRSVLTEPEAKAVLRAYAIPVVETRVVKDPSQAAQAASELGGTVVLKILSPDISHKSDVGGVRLGLQTAGAVEAAARTMLRDIATQLPDARLDGFTVQPMVSRPRAFELIAGIASDSTFGPILLFGQGGTAVEAIGDRAIGLPPLNSVLAHDLVSRTRIWRLLRGYRDRPAVALEPLAGVLIRLAQLATEQPEVVELDINPLLADEAGVLALDARIAVRTIDDSPARRMAICPYPAQLLRQLELADRNAARSTVTLRPIRPEDEPLLLDMLAHCSVDDIRMRFHGVIKEFAHPTAARLSQIDYDREMAFVALGHEQRMLGVARLVGDPENEVAEFAILVRSDIKRRGLGRALMAALIDHARARGLHLLVGSVLRENRAMLALSARLGFVPDEPSAGDDTVRVTLDLQSRTAPIW